jgi:hypothetical protein
MAPDVEKVLAFPEEWRSLKCKGVGWFYNPRESIPSRHVHLFSLKDEDSKKDRVNVVENKLSEFCTVEGVELAYKKDLDPDYKEVDPSFAKALSELNHLKILKNKEQPENRREFIKQLEKLPRLETYVTTESEISAREDYSGLNSLKHLIVYGLKTIEGSHYLPKNLETLVFSTYVNWPFDETTLKGHPTLTQVHALNSETGIKYGGLRSNSPFIKDSTHEKHWKQLEKEVPGVDFNFDVDHSFFNEKLDLMNRRKKQLLATKFATDERYVDKKRLKAEIVASKAAKISFQVAKFLPPGPIQWREEQMYPEDDMAL